MKQIIVDNISTAYYITNDGKCYNSNTGNYLKGQVNYKNGYLTYNLTLPDGRKKRCYAHRLVAIAYIENKENKKEVNHIDGNKLNNCIDNLEWVSSSENKQHALENELRKFDHIFCFSSIFVFYCFSKFGRIRPIKTSAQSFCVFMQFLPN